MSLCIIQWPYSSKRSDRRARHDRDIPRVCICVKRRRHVQSRVSITTVHELLFAHDCALNVTSERDMQKSMDLFVAACDNFGLVFNTEKMMVMHQLPSNAAYNVPHASVNGAQLQAVGNITYLGGSLSRSTKIDDEVAHRTSMTSKAFGRPQNAVRSRHGLHLAQN
ncbi:hypothetical protein SprV_0100386900 [Sparganum proliferum]